jgi:hypothetical protein
MREKAPKHRIDLASPPLFCFLSTAQYGVHLCMFSVSRLPSPVLSVKTGSGCACVCVYYGDAKCGFQILLFYKK